MLDDRRIQELLIAAREVEAFERTGQSGGVARSFGASIFRRPITWAAMAAAAAIAVSIFTLNRGGTPVSPVNTPPIVKGPSNPMPIIVPNVADAHGSVVVAIGQDTSGTFQCVRLSPEALKGRKLADLSEDELASMGLTMACSEQSSKLLVVGIEGPRTALPRDEARATEMARCMLTAPSCGPAFDAKTCAATGCVDSSLKVRVASLSLR